MSLRVRLTLFYSLFLAVVLTGVAVTVYLFSQHSLVESIQDRARQAIREIQRDARAGVQTLPRDAYFQVRGYHWPPRAWQDLAGGDSLTFVFERRNPTPTDLYALLPENVYQEVLETGSASAVLRVPDGPTLAIHIVQQTLALAEGTLEVPATLLVAYPIPSDRLTQLRYDLVRTVVGALLIFALGVWLLSKQVLSPLKRVTQAAAMVSGEDLSQRVPVPKTRDEVSELAVTLNHMLDRLQESFETQRRFTADASHELRTPVTAIVGHANYLLRRTKPTPEQVDSLTVIRREAERMAKLVNDLLELARADAGFTVEKHPINLVEVIEAVHMEVAPVAGHAEIVVDCPTPIVEVLGDEGRLKQVVLNLVQNALNAGADRITISLNKEKDKESERVRLEVLDNGPGIPGDAIPHLFDRFYRVDGARSTRGNGSGLGLAIVKWIVEQHHGEVQVESRLGEGTVFIVLLPALAHKSSEVKPAPLSPSPRPARSS
jgi:two-component system OmpR family sensor kinase